MLCSAIFHPPFDKNKQSLPENPADIWDGVGGEMRPWFFYDLTISFFPGKKNPDNYCICNPDNFFVEETLGSILSNFTVPT